MLDQYVPDIYYKQLGGKLIENPLGRAQRRRIPRCVRGGSWDDDRRGAAQRGPPRLDQGLEDAGPADPAEHLVSTPTPTSSGFRVVRPLRDPDAEEAKLYEPEIEIIKDYKEAQAGKQ